MDGAQQPELMQTREDVMADVQAAVVELRAVLDAEREALDRLDSLALDAATSAKAELLQRLDTLEVERCQLDDMAAPREASGVWRNICRQLEACRRINEVNGSIVEHRLLDVRRALGILRGSGEGSPVLYGPGGHAHAHAVRRPLSQA
ncbi:MAG TPA: flagellar protein FlgN [Rhodanobacteraceae bacterium]|nr:flagellar protein FlgN [Rhodanobacteraceae bacterium]